VPGNYLSIRVSVTEKICRKFIGSVVMMTSEFLISWSNQVRPFIDLA